jgi:TolB-like protein/DNA-binding winged helix-turn-helix (wHTH) protein
MTEHSYVVEPDHQPRIARFGTFEADLQTRELRRDGRDVRIQVQPFRILGLLLERAGQIVTREELRERLWPAEFVDFDHGLNAAIRKLREALGDSAENPRFVETLARRGYRFIAPVAWDVEKVERKDRRPVYGAAAIIALAILGVIVYLAIKQRAVAAPPNAIAAVAVLPFTYENPQTEQLSDGLTEILIDRLSRLPDLRVMARTTVFAYKGRNADPREAGKALNVGGVVVGHIRHDGDHYAIHVELIDVKDGTQLWGHQFDATTATLPSVQSGISEALTNELRAGVSRDQRRVIVSRFTRDPEAYQDYLWGLYSWNRRQDAKNVQSAVQYFSEAIARDPNFAEAYAGLANTYGVMVGYGAVPANDGSAKVMSLAGKALELDPHNAEALISIATTKYRHTWDFAGAGADYQRALALNPNYATGHEWYADYLRSMGRWDDARREIERAHQLDPGSWAINAMVCYGFYYERRYRDAIEASRRAGQLDPALATPACVAQSLIGLGQIEAAVQLLEVCHVPPDDRTVVAKAFHTGGERAFFRKSAERLALRQGENIDTPIDVAKFYAQAGDRDRAFAWLEKGYQSRVSKLTNVNVDPGFDSLRSDPRYDDLLWRIGLPKISPPAN